MKKVICIGDSIQMGYEPTVVSELGGWAHVVELRDLQCGNTRVHLDEWLQDDLDIVHMNAGLQDMAQDPGKDPEVPPDGERRVPLDEYRTNLATIFKTIASRANAVTIFGLTTPVNLQRQHSSGKGLHRTNEDVAAYNEVACEVAALHGVIIDDLHQVIVDHSPGQMLKEDGVHFTDEGSAVLGRTVAAAIHAAVA
jgi:lysophospholipase L1-like esterase